MQNASGAWFCAARSRVFCWTATVAAVIAATGAASADTITLPAVADSTLYSEDGNQANGGGDYLFAGRTDRAELRRSLIRFDLSAIPPGSTITSASLTLNCSRTRAPSVPVALHRVLDSWGEGTSQAPGEEGSGGAAAANDATWTFRFFNTTTWTTPGGVFNATASASILVDNANRAYTWTSAAMAADVQAWVDTPASNFGWILIGSETANQTAKRFDSRSNTTLANRPALTIVYTPGGGPTGACCFPDGTCTVIASVTCAAQGGTYQGDGTTCAPNPCPQPTGACCLAGAVCSVLTQVQCSAQGGLFQGAGSVCSPNPCTPTTTVNLDSVADNTLYESATGALSNGAGLGFFAGTSDNPTLIRRGVVRFDLSGIPPNALVLEARLRLYLGFTQAPAANDVTVHRALASWGEGTSDAGGNENNGAASTPNDATWIHRFFSTQLWTTPGGDFVAGASALLNVGTTAGYFEWTGSGLAADAQAWVNGSQPNHGWLLRGVETVGRTQRRFESRQNPNAALRPRLTVTYTIPAAPTGACCLPTGLCQQVTQVDCASLGGTYQGDNTSCASVSCPIILEPFVDALPLPGVAQPVSGQAGGAAHYVITMNEVTQTLHRDLPPTRVWGYAGSYPGPTIEARTDEPVTVVWVNDLRDEQGNLRTTHRLPVDTCLHGPDVTGEVPVAVVHLHGSADKENSDGYPENVIAPGQQSTVYNYPNIQPAATIWYHDHALGITRLNVMMGLAGFYLIRDDVEDALNIPRGEFEIPLAIQDRSFNPDGSIRYLPPASDQFFGDFVLVNGKVWPFLNVKQGKYRFRLLNGSNSRVYTLALSNGATFWQIGTDLGLLPAPVALTSLTIGPGERADVVMDFAPYAPGTPITLTNSAPSPFPVGGGGPDIPNVMRFVVQAQSGDTDPLPATLAPVEVVPESEADLTRRMEFRRVFDPGCNNELWLINDLMWDDITEFPVLGETEIWEWVNRSGVMHPMHMHLVAFQVLDRQDFDVVGGVVTPTGPRVPPPANERGWKDTVQAPPNQITRVIVRFDNFAGRFPYHCHILEHEDHEMMRQFQTVCPPIQFVSQPAPTDVTPGATAQFSVSATGYQLAFSWRRNGVALSDGPTGTGSTVSGATTATLSISGASEADEATYDCVVSDPCVAQPTNGAALTVTPPPACPGDTNGDNVVNGADLSVLLSQFGQSVTPGSGADFNNDGMVNGADLSVLLANFGSAC